MSELSQLLTVAEGVDPGSHVIVNHINDAFSWKSNNQMYSRQAMLRQKGDKFVPHDKEKGLFCPGFHLAA